MPHMLYSPVFTLEWLTSPGLGEGELEFVDVGVGGVVIILLNKSSSPGDVANSDVSTENKGNPHQLHYTDHLLEN